MSSPPQVRPIREISPSICAGIRAILCDLDDTLTTGGKLRPEAYEALWRIQGAGIAPVVVTGRPAGWVDHLARMWPVHGVIGENGGLYFRHAGGKMHRHFAVSAEERAEHRRRLEAIGREILAAVPGCAVAADQPYRELDRAIDFAEDVGPLPEEAVRRIQELFLARGARAKVSSIHVNGWFGEFDKLSTARLYLERELGLGPDAAIERVLFVGDSPNDEPMFSFFPHSVGIATLRRFASFIARWPAFISERAGGEGFAEVAEIVLARRG